MNFKKHFNRINEYITEKGYKVINVSKTIDIKSYNKYALSISSKPDVVLISMRTLKNNELYEYLEEQIGVKNQIFIIMNHTTCILLSSFNKIVINKMLEDDLANKECSICFNEINEKFVCKCSYKMCLDCYSKVSQCPQCRIRYYKTNDIK